MSPQERYERDIEFRADEEVMVKMTAGRLQEVKAEIKKLKLINDVVYAAACLADGELLIVDTAHKYGDAIDRFIAFCDKFEAHPCNRGYPSHKGRKQKWDWIKRHHHAGIVEVRVSLGRGLDD